MCHIPNENDETHMLDLASLLYDHGYRTVPDHAKIDAVLKKTTHVRLIFWYGPQEHKGEAEGFDTKLVPYLEQVVRARESRNSAAA